MQLRVSDSFSRHIHKLGFYSSNALRSLMPSILWQQRRSALMGEFEELPVTQKDAISKRVNYYNRLFHHFTLADTAERIGNFSFNGKSSAYCYDFRNLAQHFAPELMVDYLFGDITQVPDSPRFVKSRPIAAPETNRNAVLLKLNSVRHYRFVPDDRHFSEKWPMAVWRGKSNNSLRISFSERYADHPQCNVGCVLHKELEPRRYHRSFIGIDEQLQYRYVVSVEGIDVATNLKWIMASNSLCMMRRPRFETWFMEGTLQPGVHYVELNDDHSDLIDKIDYYNQHPEEAENIIANAQHHVSQFLDEKQERMIALLVMDKYLQLSGQLPGHPLALSA